MEVTAYAKRLEEEKTTLESEMTDLGRRNPAVPSDWELLPPESSTEPDLIDQADVAVNRDTASAIFTDLEARYDTVLAALARIAEGTYGVCNVCGAPIEGARLDADPAAETCIAHR